MMSRRRNLLKATLCFVFIWISVASAKNNVINLNTVKFNLTDDDNGCPDLVHEVDPIIHKAVYRVGYLALEGTEEAKKLYGKTFGEYLSATAGRHFNPPIFFEFVPILERSVLMDMVASQELDLVFSLTSLFSCLSAEYDARPLVTIVNQAKSRGHIYELDVFAGVMFVLQDNEEIETVYDFEDKIIGATSITSSGGGQIQFSEMVEYGISLVQGPKQVMFTGDDNAVIQGVLDGTFDVGFTWTGRIENFIDANGDKLQDDAFKIIDAQTHILDDGMLFPFVSSTELLPWFPVVALDHLDETVAREVQDALLAFGDHDMAYHLGENVRCDTTPYLADLAHHASIEGSFVKFRTARSYAAFRSEQEAAGFLVHNEETEHWHCVDTERLWEDMECPPRYIMLPEEEFKQSCEAAGLPCHGYECFCKPCVQAFEVDLFEYKNNTEIDAVNFDKVVGCDKMAVCGTLQQTKVITFRAVDNKKRANPVVEAIMHVDKEIITLPIEKVAPFTYEFYFSDSHIGTEILEVFFDGEQIPESPFRVTVVERDCGEDYPGMGMVADEYGHCDCGANMMDVQGECVPASTFAIIGFTVGALVLALCVNLYIKQRNAQNDEVWKVHPDELHFDHPMEVIGQGSFGVVLRAEYRGTKVAIKRVLQSTKNAKCSHKTTGRAGDPSFLSAGTNHNMGSQVSQDDVNSDDGVDSPTDVEAGAHPSSKEKTGILTSKKGGDTGGGDPGSSSLTGLHFSVAFLNQEFNVRKTKWAKFSPWFLKRQTLEGNTFQQVVLGAESYSKSAGIRHALCPWFSGHVKRIEDFKTEMRVLARLRHPCITTVMGAVVTSMHDPVMVMEYMEYGSLHDLLRNETMPLSGEVILQITRDLAQGLRFLHSSKPPILHGDLKARNILIDSRFRAKLCDFGLSTKRVNEVSGTPYWMAPENLMGGKYTPACDIYSVGIILYEIYSRQSPYAGENNYKEVIRGICNRRVNKRPVVPAATPPKFVDLMKKCWSADVHVRPAAMDLDVVLLEMSAEDAEPFQEGQTTETKKHAGDRLLYEIFPKHVADALKKGKKVDPETHENVTVIFSDIIKFTDISRQLSPEKVCDMLDRLYVAFDNCARRHQVFKVETIGDAWMGVTNLENNQNHTHVKHIAEFAIDIVNEAAKVMVDKDDPARGFLSIRVGFHSGSVVSNVIGTMNKRYCLFGDTVNTASRMESNSVKNRILCSERSYELLQDQAPGLHTKLRGQIQIKGKGEMAVYWVADDLLIPRLGMKEKNVEFAVPKGHLLQANIPAGIECSPSDISQGQTAEELTNSSEDIGISDVQENVVEHEQSEAG